MRKALLITDSAELRETAEILLGEELHVEFASPRALASELAPDLALIIVDGSTGSELPELPSSAAPVLLLGDRSPWRDRLAGRRHATLPVEFDGFTFRDAVRDLLRDPGEGSISIEDPLLAPPFLTPSAAQVARRAVATPLPVLIWGEAGCGKGRVVRAIHARRGVAHLLSLSAQEVNQRRIPALPPNLAEGDEITVAVGDVRDLDAAGKRLLLDLVDLAAIEAGGRLHRTRLITWSSLDPALLLRNGTLEKEVFYRLSAFPIELPPLRQRVDDIPALVEAVAQRICEGLGISRPSFTAAGMTRLSHYLWFGNLAELEAVVARSIAFARGRIIDRDDLLFGYGPILPRLAPAETSRAPRPSANGATVDLIINELAHEFKNPMVTIKTFAQHLDRGGEGDSGQEQIVRLTEEAVERMDRALENLVQFTRFQEPTRQATSLGSVVSGALRAIESDIAEKEIQLEVEPTAAQVLVDPDQIVYAVANVLRSVVRQMGARHALAVRATPSGVLQVEYPTAARAATQSLSRLLLGGGNGSSTLPLGMAFAKSLIERNGGRLSVHRDTDPAKVSIELPRGGEEVEWNGQGQGTGR